MKEINLKIGVFGDRGVGKTTFLTTLHGVLANHLYNEFEVRYENDSTVTYLKNNFSKLLSENIVDGTVGEYSIDFDLWYKKAGNEQKFKISMKDFAGENIKVERHGIQTVVNFLSTCDAILFFYSLTDKDKNQDEQNMFDFNTMLTRLTKLENGARKTKKPFVLILTKSDEIVQQRNNEFDSLEAINQAIKGKIEDDGASLISELSRFVENFKIVSTSSYYALEGFRRKAVKKIPIHVESSEIIEFPNYDVAFPITYILNQKMKNVSDQDFFGRVFKYFSLLVLGVCFFFHIQ